MLCAQVDEVPPVIEPFEQPLSFSPEPLTPESLLLDRLSEFAAPAAVAVAIYAEPPAIETVQLARRSQQTNNIAGVRRSPVSMQPVIRGYHQRSIYGQYQGAQFVPVRFDLDSLLTSIDPGVIDNLVIIPGPYGVKYGPGLAFIDIVATPTPRYDQFGWAGRTSLYYHSNGDQFYGRETLSAGGADYGVRASYGHKVGADYFAGDNTRIPASYNVRDFNVLLSRDVSSASTFDFEYLRQEMTDTEFSGLLFDARIRKTDAFFARYTYDEGCDEKWLVEGWYNRTAFAGDTLNAGKQNFFSSHPIFPFTAFTDADVASTGMRIAPTWGSAEGMQLTTGVDLHYIEYELNEFDDFGVFANFPVPRSHSIDTGAFAELRMPCGECWTLTGGARLDWVRGEPDSFQTAVDPDGNPDDYFLSAPGREHTLYHLFATAEYELSECSKLRMGFGHGQRPPNLTERYALQPFLTAVQTPTTIAAGNPRLGPERASQFDLALVADHKHLRFRLAGFWSHIDDRITFQPDPFATVPDPDLREFEFVNHDAVLAGAELRGEVDWTDWLTPFVNVSYVEGRDIEIHEPLPSIFPLETRLGIRLHEPCNHDYGIDLIARIVADQNRVATSLLELPTPGFTTFDIRGHWNVSDSWRVTYGVENVTDVTYFEHLNIDNPLVLDPGIGIYVATQLDY